VIGVGSMVGAGVFAVWGPAADVAGNGLLWGLVIAAVVAFCNATSSAQLAALHPESGGTYLYGRRQLGPGWGHLAGWGFVVGKTASCAAMALTIGAHLWPAHDRLFAVAAVVVITVLNIGGLSRTVAVTRLLLAVSLVALFVVVVGGWRGPDPSVGRLIPVRAGWSDIVQSAGLLFFAFAGYARIATLGEEVKDPATTIPRAIPLALFGVLLLYAVVAVTVLATVPVADLAGSGAPLVLVADRGGWPASSPLVRVGAGIAASGVLLNLLPGISRTGLAMARERDLPSWFAHVDPARSLPLRAELTVALIVIGLITVFDVRHSIGVSGMAVLTYYAVTNLAALTLRPEQRRWPRAVAVTGLIGCIVLAVSLPASVVVTGVGTLAIGVLMRAVVGGFRPPFG
jgi:basic amino acid/polyamine antiporter, APA family